MFHPISWSDQRPLAVTCGHQKCRTRC